MCGSDGPILARSTTGAVTDAFVSGVSGSGAVYTVTIDTGTGDGTIRLDVVDDDTILDGVGNPLGGAGVGNGGFTAGEVYNATTGTGTPLDWRWSFAAMVIAGGLVLARKRLRPRLN